MPPQVRTLDQLNQILNPLYDPARQQTNQQIQDTQTLGAQQEQGLFAEQKKAFGDIAQMASNKGMLFSGFTPDQQATYNATKFMPAVAGLRGKVHDNIARLQSALLTLDSDQRKQALGMQTEDQNKLYDYNKVQDQRAYEKQLSDQAYQRELEKLRLTAKYSAASRSSAASSKTATANDLKESVVSMAKEMQKAAGKDGFVSPEAYNQAKRVWASEGYSLKDFQNYFAGFVNPVHQKLFGGYF